MNKKKTFKRELSFDEKSNHHRKAGQRAQELKQQKRDDRLIRDAAKLSPYQLEDSFDDEDWE